MSRSGYSEDCGDDDPLALGRWRGQVESAIRGKRGQRFLFDLVMALARLPKPELISGELEEEGSYCALGALGVHRGVDTKALGIRDWEDGDWDKLGRAFDIASQLAQETMYVNDDRDRSLWTTTKVTPEQRWVNVREWAIQNLLPETLLPPEAEREVAAEDLQS